MFRAVTAAWIETGPVLQESSDGEGAIVALIFFGIGLVIVYSGFTTWQQMRLIQDTPTEKIRSAAVGRTELKGTGKPIGDPVRRPFGDGVCLLATYEIEEWEEDHHDDDHAGGGHWSTVESGTLVVPFELDDGTGRIRVEPDDDVALEIKDEHVHRVRVGAREEEPQHIVEFLRTHTDQDVPTSDGIMGFLFGEQRRYTERYIPVEADLYLLGATEPMGDAHGSNEERLVFRRDSASDEFIISEKSENELVSGYKWSGPAKIVAGIAISAVSLYFALTFLNVA
jgi:hypothetical protein